MYTGFLGGEGEMQDLATVNHVSFFIAIRIKMESTNRYGHFPKDFQAHEYSANSAPLGTSTVKWSFCQMDTPSKQN